MSNNKGPLPYSYDFLTPQRSEEDQTLSFEKIIKDEQEIILHIREHEIAISGLLKQLGEKQTLIRDHLFAQRAQKEVIVEITTDNGN
jgi:hypothetical protein